MKEEDDVWGLFIFTAFYHHNTWSEVAVATTSLRLLRKNLGSYSP